MNEARRRTLGPLVIKVGTSVLRGHGDRDTKAVIRDLAASICRQQANRCRVVLVSSGAVGLGSARLGFAERPRDLVTLQASAAVGQGQLMKLYDAAFEAHGQRVAQVLLTRADLVSRRRYRNASGTLHRLLELGVVPIINENDALAVDELRFGDNDTLSALVATVVAASELVLLTDIDRLYSADPRRDSSAEPISEVRSRRELDALQGTTEGSGRWGTGGMTTKLAAARIATRAGITVRLADGRAGAVLDHLLEGNQTGTSFLPDALPVPERKRWLTHGVLPRGSLRLDAGAVDAISCRGASLLAVGIRSVEGSFESEEVVRLCHLDGREFARGVSRHGSSVVNSIKGCRSAVVDQRLGDSGCACVVHRDDLVVLDGG